MVGALLATVLDAVLLAFALGGVGALLHHPRALSLLAIWGIGAVLLAAFRPVRTHEPSALERESPLLLAALAVLPLATGPLSAWAERAGWAPLPGGAALRWAGVAITALGLGVRIAAMVRLGSRFSPFLAIQGGHVIETAGLYAWVRHPGYLGAWLAAFGAVLAFGSAATLPLAALFLVLLYARSRREEALLERALGEEYRAYRGRTGGFVPRPPARHSGR